jgi:hypothetical protein
MCEEFVWMYKLFRLRQPWRKKRSSCKCAKYHELSIFVSCGQSILYFFRKKAGPRNVLGIDRWSGTSRQVFVEATKIYEMIEIYHLRSLTVWEIYWKWILDVLSSFSYEITFVHSFATAEICFTFLVVENALLLSDLKVMICERTMNLIFKWRNTCMDLDVLKHLHSKSDYHSVMCNTKVYKIRQFKWLYIPQFSYVVLERNFKVLINL